MFHLRLNIVARFFLASIALVVPARSFASPSINPSTLPQTPQLSYAQPATTSANGIVVPPLPQTIGGPIPSGMACCMNGIVWFNGAPVAAAEVTIQSAAGSLKVISQVFSGTTTTEPRPFYQAQLYQPPLNVQAGETLTITARYSGYTKTVYHTAQPRGQQVDITIPRTTAGVLGFASALQTQPAADGLFRYPAALATDSRGKVFVGGLAGARVWVYDAAGQFVRAWGGYGNLPDQFGRIAAMAVDAQDHVYVVDADNKRVAKFTNAGTFLFAWPLDCAQCTELGRMSIAVKTNGNVLINTNVAGAGVLMEFDGFGRFLRSRQHDSSNASFSIPGHPGITIDSAGYLYVADYRGGRVLKYTADLQPVTNEAWSSASIPGALGVQAGPDGNIYVLRSFVIGVEDRMFVQRYSRSGDLLQSLQIHPANALPLGEVWDMTISNGKLLLADRTANRILTVPMNFDGATTTAIWLAGSNNPGTFTNPRGIVAVGDDVYVADCAPGTLTRFRNGAVQKVWNGTDAGLGANWCPFDLAHDNKGQFWAVDARRHQLQRFVINGDSITQAQIWGGLGTALGQFNAPSGLGIGIAAGASDLVFIADTTNGRVQAIRIDPPGTFVALAATSLITGTGPGQFVSPWDVVADANNNVFVVDNKNHRLTKLQFDGSAFVYIGQYGSLGGGDGQLNSPTAVTRGSNGNVFVADGANSRVVEVDFSGSTGTQVRTYGNNVVPLVAPGGLTTINNLGFDNAGSLYTVQGNNLTPRVQKLSPLTYAAPVAAISALSGNAGALDASAVLTVSGVGQPSDAGLSIVAYEWTITASDANTRMFTTSTPQWVVPASQLFPRVQTVSVRVQDSAGQWSLPATSDVRIFVAPNAFPTDSPTPVVTVTPDTPPGNCTNALWLMMIYATADNPDDGAQLLARLQEVIDAVGRTANRCVQFAIQVDGPASIAQPVNDTTRWFGTPGQPLTKLTLPEAAMDKAETLHDFVLWAQSSFPANHFYLAITNHGQGMLGTGWDFTTEQPKAPLGPNSGGYYLTIAEIEAALSSSDISKLDILHLDSCSMGLFDVAYELRDSARFLIASQYLAWATFGYDDYLQAIGKDTQPDVLAKTIVARYAGAVRGMQRPFTLSAMNLEHADEVKGKLDHLGTLLVGWANGDPVRQERLKQLRDQSQLFNSNVDLINSGVDVYADALDWARNIRSAFADPITERSIFAAASDLIAALEDRSGFVFVTQRGDGALPEKVCLSGSDCNISFNQAGGVSLYYPPDALLPADSFGAFATNDTSATPATASAIYTAYVNQQSAELARASRWGQFLETALKERAETPADQLPSKTHLPAAKQVFLPVVRR